MSEFLSSLPVIRDTLLLIIQLASLGVLLTIAGLLGGQRRRMKDQGPALAEKLEQLLAAQRKQASATAATGNDLRAQLDAMVNTLAGRSAAGPAGTLNEFKSLRAEVRDLGGRLDATVTALERIAGQNQAALEQLLAGFREENAERVRAVAQLRGTLQDELVQAANRLRSMADALPETPVSAAESPTTSPANHEAALAGQSEWRQEVRTELHRVGERLDRIQQRMEEIFQF